MKFLMIQLCLLAATLSAHARTDTVLIEDLQANQVNKISIGDFGKYTSHINSNVFAGPCFAAIEGYKKIGHGGFRAGDLSFRAGALIVPDSEDTSASGYTYQAVSNDGKKFKVWTYIGGVEIEENDRLVIDGQCE